MCASCCQIRSTRRFVYSIPLHAVLDHTEMQAIEVDAYLRVKGAPLGTVYALGDSATVSRPDALLPHVH